MKAFYIPEPNLYFKDGGKCIDPKIGLLKYGPNGLNEDNQEIIVGIVGSKTSINEAKLFLNRIQYNIPGVEFEDSKIRGIDFPGIDKNLPLGFYFKYEDTYCETIPQDVINLMKTDATRKEKIHQMTNAFKQALSDLSGIHPKPGFVLVSLPREVIKSCGNPILKTKNIKLCNRTFADLKRISKLPKEERPLFLDFHHYIKAIAFDLNLKTQIIKPDTLNFSSQKQDAATIAWNFSIANFYKSTGIPWKLADLEPETIHVGVSFFNDIGDTETPVVRAAIAQVYMKTGDSQVIRGIEIPLKEEEDRIPNLNEQQAFTILKEAISLYERQHNNDIPHRVVLHKKSSYTENELVGFRRATESIAKSDFLHIYDYSDFRSVTNTKYPACRGSIIQAKKSGRDELYIYTSGYIPAFSTYPGSTVPKPIRVEIEESASSVQQISLDILNLTKLDWNSANFARRFPVTVSVSEKVGEILCELSLHDKETDPPISYANYM